MKKLLLAMAMVLVMIGVAFAEDIAKELPVSIKTSLEPGTYNLRFCLYNNDLEGTQVYHQDERRTLTGPTVKTVLGPLDGVDFSKQLWLQLEKIRKDGTTRPVSLRVMLASVSYAMFALTPAGPQGEQGIQGPIGPTGPQGIQGPKGDKGDKGDQGIQGIQGIQGPKGATGATGLQGIQGIQGLKGDKGDQGIQGIQGPRGYAILSGWLTFNGWNGNGCGGVNDLWNGRTELDAPGPTMPFTTYGNAYDFTLVLNSNPQGTIRFKLFHMAQGDDGYDMIGQCELTGGGACIIPLNGMQVQPLSKTYLEICSYDTIYPDFMSWSLELNL